VFVKPHGSSTPQTFVAHESSVEQESYALPQQVLFVLQVFLLVQVLLVVQVSLVVQISVLHRLIPHSSIVQESVAWPPQVLAVPLSHLAQPVRGPISPAVAKPPKRKPPPISVRETRRRKSLRLGDAINALASVVGLWF
jgi:hypothetical protein